MDKYISNKIKNVSLFMTFFVVLLHSNNLEAAKDIVSVNSIVQNFIGQGIVRIAVPTFFLISGYLFFYNFTPTMEKWKYKFKSRFHSLFIPYVIWCTGWLVILYVVELVPAGRALFSDRIIADYSLKELFVNTYIYPLPYQFWYIRSLMLDVILAPVFYYVIKSLGKKSLPIFVIIWFLYPISEMFGGVWILQIFNYPFMLFGIGAALAINKVDLHFKSIEDKHIAIFGLVYILACAVRAALMYTDLPLLDFAENVVILFGVPFMWLVYDKMSNIKNKKISIAKYGIFIYFFHIPFQSILKKVCFKVLPAGELSSLIVFFVAPVITIIVCVLVAMFLRRFMNRFYMVLTGGR
ncbi:MAG: acyltransferase [Intestinibacter bartlettii]|uniref:acyltransferase family protein n=1 Tax=Intestinibacter bartlettii TaxID=261299 RepID=UPI0026F1C91B|nr:acyltransferase [Intestinibacter bartlettii]MDO5011363.1 acyltransferase [Intestinibacter bartlettii]